MGNEWSHDCVQALLHPDPWWEKTNGGVPERGRLVWTFVPIASLSPRTLRPTRADDSTDHSKATFVLDPQRASGPREKALPVAAMPVNPGEVYAVYKAKRRPVVVLAVGPTVDPKSVGGTKGWQFASMLSVAPYFGADADGSRGGWHPEFIRRIRHAEYPHYVYDRLPNSSVKESILRLDQLQPIGNHHDSYELTEWKLSEPALQVLDEHLDWLRTGRVEPDSLLDFARVELPKLEPIELKK